MLKLYLMEAEPLFDAENRARVQALVEKERSRRRAAKPCVNVRKKK